MKFFLVVPSWHGETAADDAVLFSTRQKADDFIRRSDEARATDVWTRGAQLGLTWDVVELELDKET
jgi:hypothetical protein